MGGNIPNPAGGGVLRIGMIKGFFGVGNFGKYFFVWLDFCRDILRYSKQSGSSIVVHQCILAANIKYSRKKYDMLYQLMLFGNF